MNPLLQTALEFAAAGISAVPVAADGSKRPAGEWKQYQQQRATEPELYGWFADGRPLGVGLITGAVSGNLEMTEVEGAAAHHLPELAELATQAGIGDLWNRLLDGWLEVSPSGGLHWFYRLTEPVQGNRKIARTAARETLAETRGEGGFVVTAPSAGRVHPTGQPWVRVAGGPATMPTITPEERDHFHAILSTLNEEPPEPARQQPAGERTPTAGLDGTSPLDDYELQTDWTQILPPEGWTLVFTRGSTRYWRRPGKSTGISATTGNADDRDRLYVFSSATEFEPETPYTKAGAYAVLHHGGDHTKAATHLRGEGYGAPRLVDTAPAATVLTPPEGTSWPAATPTNTTPLFAAPAEAPDTTPTPGTAPNGTGPAQTATAPATATPTTTTEGALATVTELRPRTTATQAFTDDGNAALLVAEHGHELRYNPDRGRWLHWNGHAWKWQPRGGGMARELAKDSIRNIDVRGNNDARKHQAKSLSASGITNMLLQAETDTRVAVTLEELDARPWELNTPGGTIDLRTGQLQPADPTHLHTRTTAVTPDFDADPTLWRRFLADTFQDDAFTAYMQRLIGYSVVGEVREHLLPFCFGSGGNGKGVLLETIAAVLGDYATTTGNDFLMAKPFQEHSTEIAELAGARFVICSEVNEDDKFDEAKTKRLTGGDRLTARFMRQDFFNFTPTHHLWLMGNYQPGVDSGGDSFWRRLRLIPFTHTVPEERVIVDLQRILAADHGPAVLAWIAAGAAQYAASGLQEPDTVRAATADYASAMDTVGRFLEEECITGPAAAHMTVRVTQFRHAYESWCRANGETPIQGRPLATHLKRHGILVGRDAPKGPNGVRQYGNIGLLTPGTSATEEPSEPADAPLEYEA